MKYNTLSSFRNQFLLEAAHEYNLTLENVHESVKTEKTGDGFWKTGNEDAEINIAHIRKRLESRLFYTNDTAFFCQEFFKTEKNVFHAFVKDKNGKVMLQEEAKLVVPATVEEAAMLNYCLEQGYFDLFITEKTKNILFENIKEYFNNIAPGNWDNISDKLNFKRYIIKKGETKCPDDFCALKDKYLKVQKFISGNKCIKYKYIFNGEEKEYTIRPMGFLYSKLDKKIRVVGINQDGTKAKIYLSLMKDIDEFTEGAFKEKQSEYYIKIKIEKKNNSLERFLSRINDCKREICQDKESNEIYIIKIYYHPMDEKRIIGRILSLSYRITFIENTGKKKDRSDRTGYVKTYIKNELEKMLKNYES